MVDCYHLDGTRFNVPSSTNGSRGHRHRRGRCLLLWIRLVPPNTICVIIYANVQVHHHPGCVLFYTDEE
jgi:hypothetical protein